MSAASVFEEFTHRVGAREPEAAAALFSEAPDFFIPGPENIPFNGRRRNREEIAQFFRDLWENLLDSDIEISDLIVSEPHIVAIGRVTHTAAGTGRRFPNEFAWHLVIVDDQIQALQVYDDTNAVVQAFETAK